MQSSLFKIRCTAARLIFLNAILLAPLSAHDIGSRQPEVSDWHLFHRNNDAHWARWLTDKSGWDPVDHVKIEVSASDVRRMRLLAGIGDDEPADAILKLDAMGMRHYEYLMVTALPGGCLRAAIYRGGSGKFKELWSSDVLGNEKGICQQAGCPGSEITAGKKHEIDILTYSRSNPDGPVCDRTMIATFEPKGDTFELQDRQSRDSMCWVGYGAGLSAALWKAAGPAETIVIVKVLSAFSSPHALALQRSATGMRVLRLRWHEEESPLVGPLSTATASACFAQAASTTVSAAKLNVRRETAEGLAGALSKIDLRADRCVRAVDGQCTMFLDGRNFLVEVPGHEAVTIFDLRGEHRYVSQNPDLAGWISKLLDAANDRVESE